MVLHFLQCYIELQQQRDMVQSVLQAKGTHQYEHVHRIVCSLHASTKHPRENRTALSLAFKSMTMTFYEGHPFCRAAGGFKATDKGQYFLLSLNS